VLDVFPTVYPSRIRELTRPNRRNAVLTALAAPLMDRSTDIRQRIMTFAVDTEHSAETLAADDALLEALFCAGESVGHGTPADHGAWATPRIRWR
jgi:predicted oxidoreductase